MWKGYGANTETMNKQRILTNINSQAAAQHYLFVQEVETTKDLYFDKDMTAEDVCKAMGIGKWYNDRIQRDFYQRLGPKGKGHGGKRRGSGNKKGVRS